jgi:hypothetical protein
VHISVADNVTQVALGMLLHQHIYPDRRGGPPSSLQVALLRSLHFWLQPAQSLEDSWHALSSVTSFLVVV